MWPFLYNILLFRLARFLISLIALLHPKIRSTIQGKRGVHRRLRERLKSRDTGKKLIWFHAPSAGEFIQLQPLLESFLNNDFDCIVTYNSDSARIWIEKYSIKATRQPLSLDHLPFDSRRDVRRWISIAKPSCLVFVKYDLWPNTIWEASNAGIPIYLTSATLHAGSKRFRSPISRSFFRELYSHFRAIFVVSEDDQARFLETSSQIKRLEIFGDTRYDATLNQRDRRPLPYLPQQFHLHPVFIVGSSWPLDESCIFPALKQAMEEYPDLHLIIAPHEPTAKHLQNSESYFAEFDPQRLSSISADSKTTTRILLVDSIGILSSLYPIGLMAYIGGGFTTGVHNVMEPCATGMTVLFGPQHANSGEALHLAEAKLSFPIADELEFKEKLFELLKNLNGTRQLGIDAKAYIESQAGATEKCYQAIVSDLENIQK